jgi:hypothetical protein
LLIFNLWKRKKIFGIFLICVLFSPTLITNAQPTLSIYTEKEVYGYGDFLIFTVEVSEISEEFAILHIIDETGKKSSAIPITITGLKTVVPSSFPFEAEVYPIGKYTLEIEYFGSTSSTEFELIDAGNIVIPSWVREFAKYWYNGAISDLEFANAIGFLIKEEIIVVPLSENNEDSNEVIIPRWIKASTGWWIDRIISDKEYALSLEYLIKNGIIVV